MIIASVCIHFRILFMKDDQRSSKSLYIYIVFYIISIIFCCLLFQGYGINYIIIILITKVIDFFGLLLYILILTFTFIHFWWKINLNDTIIISILALIEIIYI